ncbi:hypothetical protein JZU61_07970 [bacterium]|nr:hypothetical protein [bacterium]
MSNTIKTIQNLLRIQKRFDLALKFENAYIEKDVHREWNETYKIAIFYVNPIYYFELQKIDTEDKQLILEFINGFRPDYSETTNIEFAINENMHQSNIGDAVYIFVDESGDMDFSTKGSKHYMFNFLVKTRPFQLHEYIANYRYELIE